MTDRQTTSDVLVAPMVIEYPFIRTTGPVIGAFLTGLREGILVGAGTVLDPETARICMLAGAQFFVTPSLRLSTIEMVKRYSKVICCGALTPTEIVRAWQAGADGGNVSYTHWTPPTKRIG